jgi:hypothetical protein
MYFTVKTVFAIPVCVVSSLRVEAIVALRSPLVLSPPLVLEWVVTLVLESGDFVFFILGYRLAFLIDDCHGLRGFGSRFPLSVGCHLIHVVQHYRVLIVLGRGFLQISGQSSSKQLHLEEL